VVASVACLAVASAAHAQGIGFQGGATIDPEQAYVGTHLETPEIARGFLFRPGIDGAFGNDLTLASINLEFLYKHDLGGAWKIYQGGGPVIYILRAGEPPEREVTGGFTAVFGFGHDSGLFAEFKAASGRGPALKFGVGWTLLR
jgi:hypothetical protein